MLSLKRFLRSPGSSVAAPGSAFSNDAVAVPIIAGPSSSVHGSGAIRSTIDLVEADLLHAVATVDRSALAANTAAGNANEALQDIKEQTKAIGASAMRMSGDISAIAQSTEELSSSASELAVLVADANSGTGEAARMAQEMTASFAALMQAANEIGSILDTISGIARQTNLLALNATIEAARAGEAGRGFAVVAQEVKNLSGSSEQAATRIRTHIESLQNRVKEVTVQANGVVGKIADGAPLFAGAAQAVEEQKASTGELARRVNEAARFAVDIDREIETIDSAAQRAGQRSQAAQAASQQVSQGVSDLGRRFVTVIRQTSLGNRRATPRLPAELPVIATFAGGFVETSTIDISTGGLLLAAKDGWNAKTGHRLEVKLAELPAVSANVVEVSTLGVHVSFAASSAAFVAGITSLFSGLEEQALPLIRRSQTIAGEISSVFEKALSSREVTSGDLFDVDYQPVAGTAPQQFTNKVIKQLENWLIPLQETLKASDPAIIFCCAVDRNGYLPVHNVEYSKPQLPDDALWNAANCRNKRIFDDRAGLTCARSTQPYLIHAYRRDMGGGKFVVLKEYVAPITVNGRHWGGFRCAYKI